MMASELEARAMVPLTGARRWYALAGAILALVILAIPFALRSPDGATGALEAYDHWGVHLTSFAFFLGIALSGVIVTAAARAMPGPWTSTVVRLAGVTAVSATVVALVSIIVAIGDMGRLVDTVLYGDISNPFVLPGIVVALYLVTTPGVLYFGAVPDIHRVALRSRGLKFLYRILSYGYVDTPGQRKEVRRLALGVAALSAVALLVVHLVLVQVVDGIADQPAWIEAMGKSSFVVNGLMAGVSISVILLLAFYRGLFPPVCARDGILPCAGRALLVALAVGAISFAWTTTTGAGAEQAWGDDNGPITLLVLVTGFVGPIAALAISGPCSHRGLLLASSLVLATTWVRMNLLVVPGLTLHEGAAETGIYLPTLSEWGLLLGYMAIFGMVILVLLRLLPFLSLWELDDGGPSPESREVAEA